MLFLLLKRFKLAAAWLAAAVFALHPVQVETVAWVTELKNTLSGFFYLVAANLLLAPLGLVCARGDRPRGRSLITVGLALGMFVLALLSKSVTATLPAAMLVMCWWRTGRIERRQVVTLIPFFVIGMLLGLHTALIERGLVQAYGQEWHLSPVERILVASRACWFYLATLAWPSPLMFIYPRWVIDDRAWWQYVPVAAAAVLLAGLVWVSRSRIGRGPLAVMLFFGGTLVPAIGFFDVYPFRYSWVADHFQYLASMGPVSLVICGAGTLAARARIPRTWQVIAAVVLLALVACGTRSRIPVFRSPITLWTDTADKNPSSWIANNNLGLAFVREGRRDEARAWFDRALECAEFPADGFKTAVNIGSIENSRGDPEAAKRWYRAALEVYPAGPADPQWRQVKAIVDAMGGSQGHAGGPDALP
jgi:tetratricopeptide (TPR) repeat protein